jgi:2-polyprenyl-6-methoxyphenol hydroxylase-like FAD-dependent oxidoreductase
VLSRGFEPRRAELRRLDGTVLKYAELPPEALGGPMIVTLRPALHGALLEAVGMEAITLESEITGFAATDNRVTLQTASGVVAEGDVLIGADGVGSIVRRALHSDEGPPRSSGIVAVRGALHGAQRHLGELDAVYYLGRGVESMLVRASDTGIYWFLSMARALVPPGMQDPPTILALMSQRFDSTFRAVTSATDDLRYDELVDRDPIPFWGRDVVTLLGDAAHPVLPHTGQGAAQAIVDAVTLGEALTGDVDVEHALRKYERERLAKMATLLKQGRRTARIMGTMNPLACYMREIVVRLIPVRPFAKFYVRINRRAGTEIEPKRG